MSPKKILVIDDDVEMTLFMKEVLKGDRYEVALAHTGPEAVEKSVREIFDLVLLDIRMPFFSGFWFCDALKQRPQTKNIPVIVVSGLPVKESMDKAYQVGASAYLKKPFRAEELLSLVNKVLGNGHHPPSAADFRV